MFIYHWRNTQQQVLCWLQYDQIVNCNSASQNQSQHSHYYKSLFFLERERILPWRQRIGEKFNNFSKTTHFKYDNIYKSLKGMNYPVMEKQLCYCNRKYIAICLPKHLNCKSLEFCVCTLQQYTLLEQWLQHGFVSFMYSSKSTEEIPV